jgi:gamma-glutamyltranspeptidase/glutathione hydrolase
MEFSYTQKREYTSYAQRSVAMGKRGMVASSQQLATFVGCKILMKGGNAVDAAVAMMATLSVVEPHSVGIGGDAFALIYMGEEKKVIGMNASGRAPYRANTSFFHNSGGRTMPERGIRSVTVPGALHGWWQALQRYGTVGLADVFEDAIYYAENGFPVTEVIAGEWKSAEDVLQAHKGSSETYLIDGRAPKPGEVFTNRDMARTFRKVVNEGIETFYQGETCEAIVAFSKREDGFLSHRDFRDHSTTWLKPISCDYRGYTVYELPPNGQGITALEMLNILEGYDIGALGHNSPEYLHLLIEAKKVAFSDRDRFVADPEFQDVPVDRLLSREYAKQCRDNIAVGRAIAPPGLLRPSSGSDTVYVAAMDKDGNGASFISSLYMSFGSGMVVDGTGIVLQNRGNSFSLDPNHPNRLEPHKRPMHTIMPGMVFKDGEFLMSFGVMGGDMQPQGHVQFLVNLIDFKMNLQEAMDAPRVRHLQEMDVYLEDGISAKTASALRGKGHQTVRVRPVTNQVGGGQAIYLDRSQNVLLGASDRRKDGSAIGY